MESVNSNSSESLRISLDKTYAESRSMQMTSAFNLSCKKKPIRVNIRKCPKFSPDYMANFSPASEINPLKIKLSITWRGIQPGAIQLGLKILARFAEKSEKIPCNRNGISARAEKLETRWLPLRSRSDFTGIKAIKERILSLSL